MKILYVAPEHVSGGFNIFVRGHAIYGNQARYVTFFPNRYGFEEDICFDLIGMPVKKWVRWLKNKGKFGDQSAYQKSEILPYWKSSGVFEDILFRFRDRLNAPIIEKVIAENQLNDFDIYHFEQGADPYRDGRWVKSLQAKGKALVCFYHGTDVRNRGLFEEVHKASRLILTSEIDLLPRIPGMKYLYLPLDTEQVKPDPRKPDGRIRIAHAARKRAYKGSDQIEKIVNELARNYPVDWVMIENLPHKKALALKSKSDIFIDQITDLGGWGYGASSVESLALGVPTITRINDRVADFLGDHPFVNTDGNDLKSVLINLIENEALRRELSTIGRKWVVQRHGLASVMESLYSYYRQFGLI